MCSTEGKNGRPREDLILIPPTKTDSNAVIISDLLPLEQCLCRVDSELSLCTHIYDLSYDKPRRPPNRLQANPPSIDKGQKNKWPAGGPAYGGVRRD